MSDAIARIIDANLNRAREAVRVLEDVARFGLDDPNASEQLKSLRHGLQEAAAGLPLDRLSLLASRDTTGDVGTRIKAEGEMSRSGLHDLVTANAARLGEALRSLEEAAKTLSGRSARRFEEARYAAYEIETRLASALGSGRARQWRLCVLLTQSLCVHPWEQVAELAIEGGADCLQLREKDLPDIELLARARRLADIVRNRAAVILNDRPDIALIAGIDGIHVGPQDLPIEKVRQLVGGKLLIGASCANISDAEAAIAAGADYCGLGPMFATPTKNKPVRQGPALAEAYLSSQKLARVPHLAIGGIDAEKVTELARRGVKGVAVSAAVCGSSDPAGTCAAILRGLGGEP